LIPQDIKPSVTGKSRRARQVSNSKRAETGGSKGFPELTD